MAFINSLHYKIFIPTTQDELWEFMSNPLNLQKITPPSMDFKILNKNELGSIYAGQIITYKVKPIGAIAVNWVTEITQVKDKSYFIDEQRFGPYSFWHHKHFIEPTEGGMIMTDLVHYKLPMGIFAAPLVPFVKNKLKEIFDFRQQAISQLWPGSKPITV